MVVAKLFDAVGTTMELAGKYEMLQELANILICTKCCGCTHRLAVLGVN